ncbi:MAG: SH3 domain-containing protein [Siculibacillus sp.]|nr:SH3 domain-containing protein [Siculibacillus sp.]
MKIKAAALASAIVLAALAAPAAGQSRGSVCLVADPTGTLLNVRATPNGRVVGEIVNGVWVRVGDMAAVNGKPWALIHDSDMAGTLGDRLGWVFAAYLKCR